MMILLNFFCALQTVQVEMLATLLLEMHDIHYLDGFMFPPFLRNC